jgi:hypothetical protein
MRHVRSMLRPGATSSSSRLRKGYRDRGGVRLRSIKSIDTIEQLADHISALGADVICLHDLDKPLFASTHDSDPAGCLAGPTDENEQCHLGD